MTPNPFRTSWLHIRQLSVALLSVLANVLNIQVGIFEPIGAGGAEVLEANYYISTMRKSFENLTTAFGGQPQALILVQPRQRTSTTLSQWVRV